MEDLFVLIWIRVDHVIFLQPWPFQIPLKFSKHWGSKTTFVTPTPNFTHNMFTNGNSTDPSSPGGSINTVQPWIRNRPKVSQTHGWQHGKGQQFIPSFPTHQKGGFRQIRRMFMVQMVDERKHRSTKLTAVSPQPQQTFQNFLTHRSLLRGQRREACQTKKSGSNRAN